MLFCARGQGLLEVLVALLILGIVGASFLALAAGFLGGTLLARQREAAARCAADVIERLRADREGVRSNPSCGDPTFPGLSFEVQEVQADWGSVVTVSVYQTTPAGRRLVYRVSAMFSPGVGGR